MLFSHGFRMANEPLVFAIVIVAAVKTGTFQSDLKQIFDSECHSITKELLIWWIAP